MENRIPDTGQDPRRMVAAGYAKVVDGHDAFAALDRIAAGEDPDVVMATTPMVWIPFESTETYRAGTGDDPEHDASAPATQAEQDTRRLDILWDQHVVPEGQRGTQDFARPDTEPHRGDHQARAEDAAPARSPDDPYTDLEPNEPDGPERDRG